MGNIRWIGYRVKIYINLYIIKKKVFTEYSSGESGGGGGQQFEQDMIKILRHQNNISM
jgi:hypothetical protein